MTDVHTQWTETRAVANRGQHVVQGAIAEVEAMLPFAILSFDTDNGGEFLNWHLVNYFRQRPAPVGFTRSRPYPPQERQCPRRAEELDPCAPAGRLREARRPVGRRFAR